MSDILEMIANNILDPEEGGDPNPVIDLDEDQIEELLKEDDPPTVENALNPVVPNEIIDLDDDDDELMEIEPPEQQVLVENGGNSDEGFEEEAAVLAEEVHSVKEEESGSGDGEAQIEEDDDDVIEEIVENVENGAETEPSRKRAAESSNSPAQKRPRGRVQTYFAARQRTIDMITQIFGSWDASLRVSSLETIKRLSLGNKEKVHELTVENNKLLHAEIARLRTELHNEKRAHAGTHKALKELSTECDSMRKKLGQLGTMITQPVATQLLKDFFQDRQPAPAPIHHHHHHPHHQIAMGRQPLPPRMGVAPAGTVPQRFVPTAPQIRRGPSSSYGAPISAGSAPRVLEDLMVRPYTRTATPRSWKAIPHPANNMGHKYNPANINNVQEMLDVTRPNDNTIMLCVPLVHDSRIISTGDYSRLPKCPQPFASLAPNPDLTVTISSSVEDFRENWQIGGKINFEYLSMSDLMGLQVYVQVSSLKACGMKSQGFRLDWGVSKVWECKGKSRKFRVTFHQQQQLPVNDRITIVVAARNSVNNSVQVSQPVFLDLA